MARWLIYTRERFPLLTHLILILGLALPIWLAVSWKSFLCGGAGLFLFFFALRAMDEWKDYEKDCIAHPARPIPRGLISPAEMRKLIHLMLGGLVFFSLLLALFFSMQSAIAYLLVVLYLYGMYREFFLGSFLKRSPLLYAFSHQLVLFPLVFFIESLCGHSLSAELWTKASLLLSGFFCYEVCRKLDPEAHPLLQTYPQIYGYNQTAALIFCLLLGTMAATYCLGMLQPLIFWATLALGAELLAVRARPARFRTVEVGASLYLLLLIYALPLHQLGYL